MKDSFLHQHVEKATRKRGNDDPSLLDLVLTDEAMQISELKHHSPIGKSDHSVLTFNFHCYLDYNKPKDRLNYAKGDYDAMRNELVITNWAGEFIRKGINKNVEELWDSLNNKLTNLARKFVPRITISNQPKWRQKGFPINREALNAIQDKDKKHRKWIASLNNEERYLLRFEYTQARNKVRRLLRKEKRSYEQGIALKAKNKP